MRDLFIKPIETLTDDDVRSVIGWPESLVVEYKADLPAREGRSDAWLTGGNVEQYAKEKLFKEVVALANTSGGHVVVGISETKEKPPAATDIRPIPRCVELAERLERAAQSIDPPIPLLLVRGIPTLDDGSGVVLFRVPPSRNAPHRSIDKDCYVRRGTNSVPVNMREIQDMTFSSDRRSNRVEMQFSRCSIDFSEWSPATSDVVFSHFRVSAVPVGASFDLGRLFGREPLFRLKERYRVQVGDTENVAPAIHLPRDEKPILRGVRFDRSEERGRSFVDIHSDGVVNVGVRSVMTDPPVRLYIAWIIGYATNMLHIAHQARTAGGIPDCEYAIEAFMFGSSVTTILDWSQEYSHGISLGELRRPLSLPRVSFGPVSEIDVVLSTICTDLCDALGVKYPEPRRIKVL